MVTRERRGGGGQLVSLLGKHLPRHSHMTALTHAPTHAHRHSHVKTLTCFNGAGTLRTALSDWHTALALTR